MDVDNIIRRLIRPKIAEKIWYFPAEGSEFSVDELVRKIKKYAGIMQHLKIKKGDCIALINNNSSDLVCLFYACWMINAVAVPLRTQTGKIQRLEDFIERCHQVCGFKLLISDDNLSFNQEEQKILQHSLSSFKTINAQALEQPFLLNAEDTAIIQFSSGSTGHPKGVIVNHGMVMAQLKNIEQLVFNSIGTRNAKCYAVWAPLNHDMGIFVGLLSPIYQGTHGILAPSSYFIRNPMRWFEMMSERGVEVAVFTNSVLARCLPILERKIKDNHLDLSQCRIYLGAEKVSETVLKEAYRILEPLFGSRDNLYNCYGMAENGLSATATPTGEISVIHAVLGPDNSLKIEQKSSEKSNAFASVGIPFPDHQILIKNNAGDILPDCVLGEIYIKSDSVSSGYLNNPDKTKEAFVDGFFKTGDLGFWYKEQLYFHSRKDDLIINNGQNIVPDDIESLIETLDFVRVSSSALFSIDDNTIGLQLLVLLVESTSVIDAKEISDRKNRIISFAFSESGILLNNIIFCAKGSIEKTSSGKKRRKVIKQRYIHHQIKIIQGRNTT